VKLAELRPVLESKPPEVKARVFERMVRQELAAGHRPERAIYRYEGSYGALDRAEARRVILQVQAEARA
jgi:hypothetical protein